jgi:chromosome segregation ATPase
MQPALEKIAKELTHLDNIIAGQAANLKRIEEHHTELRARIAEDAIDARRQQEEIDKLRETLAEVTKERDQLKEDPESFWCKQYKRQVENMLICDNKIDDLEKQLADSIKQRDDLLKHNAEIVQISNGFAAERNTLQAKCDGLAEQIKVIEADRAKLREKINHFDAYIGRDFWSWMENEAENNLASMSNAMRVMIRAPQLRAIISERDQVKYSLKMRDEANANLHNLIDQLRRDLAEQNKATANAISERNVARESADTLRKKLEDMHDVHIARTKANTKALNEKTAEIERLRSVVKSYAEHDASNALRFVDAVALLKTLMQRAYMRLAYNEADEIAAFLGEPLPTTHEYADIKPATPAPKYRDVTDDDLGRKDVEFSGNADFTDIETGELRHVCIVPSGEKLFGKLSGHAVYRQFKYARVPV